MRKGILLAALVACAALFAAGCGGGGGGGTETVTASSISKGEYIKKASEICEDAAKRIQAAFTVHTLKGKGESSGTAGLIEEIFAPNVEQEIEELRELGAPKNDVDTVEAMLKAREEALVAVEKDPKSAVTNVPFEKSIKAAKAYGLAACAVP